jgi:hypothetical protein
MKVYLTYFRYDRGECYSIYNLDTSLNRSLKSWREKDLPNFLGYGPDDVSQLYLVKCDLTKSEVQVIKDFMDSDKDYDKDFYNLMNNKVHKCHEEICGTSGDETWEVVNFTCEYCNTMVLFTEFLPYRSTLDFDDKDTLREQVQEILFHDDQMWETVLKKYIKTYY